MFRTLLAAAAAVTLLAGAGASHAAIVVYQALLTGPNESPANLSPGVGLAFVTVNDVANSMEVDVSFSGLLSPTSASHIHCCTSAPGTGTAIVATALPFFPGFPLGVTSGTYSQLFDLTLASTYNAAFITAHSGTTAGAEAALLGGLAAGEAYLNIHTQLFPSGEIRGFLTAVPEPATWAILLTGFGLAGAALRRRRSAPA